MKFDRYDIVYKELPGHIALAFSISGCPHKCEGCHSSHLADDIGEELTNDKYLTILNKYRGYITAVLFLGGEWYVERLKVLSGLSEGVKMALYSGSDNVDRGIVESFDIIKLGRYNGKPLDNRETNQRYYVKDSNGIFE